MQNIIDKVKNLKGSSSQMLLVSAGIGVAIFILAMVYLFAPDKYQVLYTGLNTEDSLEIQQYLSSKGIEYKTEEKGGTLLINGDLILIKRDLALQNLPRGEGVGGLARFDEMSIGSTKFDKEIQYQNRLQEELQTSIVRAFDGIASANVKLPRIQEKSIFEENNQNTTISVAIKMKDGQKISPENVRAIQVFVAASIHEVTAEDVEVVDSKMNVLSNLEDESATSNLSKQGTIAQEAKQQIEKELTAVLERVYGEVKVIANVDINFDEIVQNIEKYDPEGTIISREDNKEYSSEVSKDLAGEPGTDQNGEVPRYEIENLNAEDTLYLKQKEDLIENFVVGKTVEKIIKHPELRNTNVAVWVDSNLTPEEIVELEEMVAISSGMVGQVTRVVNEKAVYANGSVKVTQREFVKLEEVIDEEPAPIEVKSKNLLYIVIGLSALLLLFLVVIIVLVIRGKKKKQAMAIEQEALLNSAIAKEREIENIGNRTENEIEPQQKAQAPPKQNFKFEWTSKQNDLRELTNEVSKKFPKETADVIKKLMRENDN